MDSVNVSMNCDVGAACSQTERGDIPNTLWDVPSFDPDQIQPDADVTMACNDIMDIITSDLNNCGQISQSSTTSMVHSKEVQSDEEINVRQRENLYDEAVVDDTHEFVQFNVELTDKHHVGDLNADCTQIMNKTCVNFSGTASTDKFDDNRDDKFNIHETYDANVCGDVHEMGTFTNDSYHGNEVSFSTYSNRSGVVNCDTVSGDRNVFVDTWNTDDDVKPCLTTSNETEDSNTNSCRDKMHKEISSSGMYDTPANDTNVQDIKTDDGVTECDAVINTDSNSAISMGAHGTNLFGDHTMAACSDDGTPCESVNAFFHIDYSNNIEDPVHDEIDNVTNVGNVGTAISYSDVKTDPDDVVENTLAAIENDTIQSTSVTNIKHATTSISSLKCTDGDTSNSVDVPGANQQTTCDSVTGNGLPSLEISTISELDFITNISGIAGFKRECQKLGLLGDGEDAGSTRVGRACSVHLHDIYSDCCSKGRYRVVSDPVGVENGTGNRRKRKQTVKVAELSEGCEVDEIKCYETDRENIADSVSDDMSDGGSGMDMESSDIKVEQFSLDDQNVVYKVNSKPLIVRKAGSKATNVKKKEDYTVGCSEVDTDFFVGKYQSVDPRQLLKVYSKRPENTDGCGKKPFRTRCNVCGYAINDRNLLKLHEVAMHTNRKMFACKLCRYVSNLEKDMRKHVYSHCETRQYQCNQCSVKAKSPHYIKRHIKDVHTAERPFACFLCGFSSKRKHHIISHLMRHRGVKNHACDQCSFKSFTPFELKQHKVTHTDLWSFRCEYAGCSARARTKTDMTRHRELVHATARAFICNTCGNVFKTLRCLSKHQAVHSDRRWVCDICQKPLKSRVSLARHVSLHQGLYRFYCSVCGKQFSNKSNLANHSLTHVVNDQRPFHCPICQHTSASMHHILSHIGVSHRYTHAYYCIFCLNPYKSFMRLQFHLARSHKQDLTNNPSKRYLLDILKPDFDGVKLEAEDYVSPISQTVDTTSPPVPAVDAASKIPVFRNFTLPLATAGFRFNLLKKGSNQDPWLLKLGIITADQAEERKIIIDSKKNVVKNRVVRREIMERNRWNLAQFKTATMKARQNTQSKPKANTKGNLSKKNKMGKGKNAKTNIQMPLTTAEKRLKLKFKFQSKKNKKESMTDIKYKKSQMMRNEIQKPKLGAKKKAIRQPLGIDTGVQTTVDRGSKLTGPSVKSIDEHTTNDDVKLVRVTPVKDMKLIRKYQLSPRAVILKTCRVLLETMSGTPRVLGASNEKMLNKADVVELGPAMRRKPSRYADAIQQLLKPEKTKNKTGLVKICDSNISKSVVGREGKTSKSVVGREGKISKGVDANEGRKRLIEKKWGKTTNQNSVKKTNKGQLFKRKSKPTSNSIEETEITENITSRGKITTKMSKTKGKKNSPILFAEFHVKKDMKGRNKTAKKKNSLTNSDGVTKGDDCEVRSTECSAPLFVSEIPDKLRLLYNTTIKQEVTEPQSQVECLRHENFSSWNDEIIYADSNAKQTVDTDVRVIDHAILPDRCEAALVCNQVIDTIQTGDKPNDWDMTNTTCREISSDKESEGVREVMLVDGVQHETGVTEGVKVLETDGDTDHDDVVTIDLETPGGVVSVGECSIGTGVCCIGTGASSIEWSL